MDDAIVVSFNGQNTAIAPLSSVAHWVTQVTGNTHHNGLAVAVNGRVLARSQWAHSTLKSGDQIELIQAVQGG